jgi:hypothetical protein
MIATFRLPIFDQHRLLTMAAFRRYIAALIIPVIPAFLVVPAYPSLRDIAV